MNTLIGEALIGEGVEVAHIDLAVGSKGSAFETAFISALASPSSQHTPLLAVLEPNMMSKPATLMVNKVSIKNENQATLIFGPAQAAVARAVVDSVAEGIITKNDVENILIIVSVFIHWNARDKKKIYEYNYEATKLAIKRAYHREPKIEEVLSKRQTSKHPFMH
ncbi:formaldehyde-activating enzyme [Methanocella sp. CWC-04]|uniref:5,6,7,8-tetrahydromethanopterin hydro-lyase n=1 Tax=Methanooceanicella nereidis TaxID=2052831 RepID=A0AAP2RE70_9EURY|nr:formaldehyde-activating enzyme [Methanocella sp. CWC-04]MCD1295643.1 formaldehyde-activating enzyme [Methanocella sp. CWC-04]